LSPIQDCRIQPSSVHVTLGSDFLRFSTTPTYGECGAVDPRDLPDDLSVAHVVEPGECYTIRPGEFVLGTTAETVALPDDLAARAEGKSSLARLSLPVHITGGFIDPGFTGQITLEFNNVAPFPTDALARDEDRPIELRTARPCRCPTIRPRRARQPLPGAAGDDGEPLRTHHAIPALLG
jgi:deoxycytidine triphosphate deaminase